MITFYPRDIGLWRGHFDFAPDITLTPKSKTNHQRFSDRDDLIGFCKQHGVRLDDPENPFEILGPENHPTLGPDTYVVKQWTVLGWIRDDYTSALGHNTYNTETVKMNPRIRELAEQAKQELADRPKGMFSMPLIVTQEKFNEKFAELIVRECIDIAYEYDAPKMSGPGMIIAGQIQDHFGLDE